MRCGSVARLLTGLAVAWAAVAGVCGCSKGRGKKGARAKRMEVFIPCGLVKPMTLVVKQFEKENEVRLKCTYGTPSKLLDKIEREGRRPDVFMSPGERETNRLQDQGLIDTTTRQAFGEYAMVLITPKANPGKVTCIDDLTRDSVRTIALADPEFNSTGHYAKQVLVHLGLWDKIQGKIASPRQAWHGITYVGYGKADAGFTYNACPLRTAPGRIESKTLEIIEELPLDAHDPILCTVAALESSKHADLAKQFIEFLMSERIQKRMSDLGIPNVGSLGLDEGQPAGP